MLVQNFEVIKGETFVNDVFIRVNNKVCPLPNFTAYSEIRPYVGSKVLTDSFACEIFPDKGLIRMTLTKEQTNNLPAGIQHYDLLLINNETQEAVYYISGRLIIKKHITELPT